MYGHDIQSVHTVQSWFKCFQSVNFDVNPVLHSGQKMTENSNKTEQDWTISN